MNKETLDSARRINHEIEQIKEDIEGMKVYISSFNNKRYIGYGQDQFHASHVSVEREMFDAVVGLLIRLKSERLAVLEEEFRVL